MTATLLTGPDQKEGLSLAYVKALAARAGFSTAVPGARSAAPGLLGEPATRS